MPTMKAKATDDDKNENENETVVRFLSMHSY